MKTTIQTQNTAIAKLPPKELEICHALVLFNQLRAFKLDAVEVLEWKDTIMRLRPDLEPARLEFAILALISGEIEYNKDLGIQNIIRALKQVGEDENGFKIFKAIY